MTRTISYKRLKRAGACSEYTRLFRSLFGERRVPVNEENTFALAPAFNWDWARDHLLTGKQYRVYQSKFDKLIVDARNVRERMYEVVRTLGSQEQRDLMDAGVRSKFSERYYQVQASAFETAYNSPKK